MNPTRTLVLKDLRLSLDALVPWALIVIGITLLALVVRRIPTPVPWFELDALGLGDVVFLVGVIVGGSTPIVALWSTGAIIHGDRSHGAGMLVGVIPIAGSIRVLVKAAAIIGAALLPLGIALLLAAIGVVLQGRSPMEVSEFVRLAQFTLFGTVLAVGFMLAAAPLSTTTRGTLAGALVVGVAATTAALVGHSLAGSLAFADHHAAIERLALAECTTANFARRFGEITATGLGAAMVGGTVLAAIVGGGAGLWSIARPRRLRWTVAAPGLALVAALAGGTVASWVAIRRELTRQPQAFTFLLATDSELIAAIEGYRTRRDLPVRSALETPVENRGDLQLEGQPAARARADFEAHVAAARAAQRAAQGAADIERHVAEARRRVLALPEAERSRDPLSQALLGARDFSTAQLALATMDWPIQSETEALTSAFDAALAFPADRQLRRALRWKLLLHAPLALWRIDSAFLVSGARPSSWPLITLITALTPLRDADSHDPAFGSPLWALQLRNDRITALNRELMRLGLDTDLDARDRNTARVDEIQSDLERMRAAEADPAALEAALDQDLLRLLHVVVERDGPLADRATSLIERLESLGLGGWDPQATPSRDRGAPIEESR